MFTISTARRHPFGLRVVAMIALTALLTLSLACYGTFPLTKAVYHFNGEVTDNPLGQSILFWVFIILPVYGLAQMGDALIFNLIEFWTGESLQISSADPSDALYQTAMSEDGTALRIMASGDPSQGLWTAEVSPGTFEVRTLAGDLAGIVHRTDAGDLELCDAQGEQIRVITAEQIAANQL